MVETRAEMTGTGNPCSVMGGGRRKDDVDGALSPALGSQSARAPACLGPGSAHLARAGTYFVVCSTHSSSTLVLWYCGRCRACQGWPGTSVLRRWGYRTGGSVTGLVRQGFPGRQGIAVRGIRLRGLLHKAPSLSSKS